MEQIPLSLVLTDTVMGCPTYYRFQDDALVSEWSIRIITYSIAEIMSITGRVAEVILALILAVSYTHLDVYKRQAFGSSLATQRSVISISSNFG